MRTCLNRNNHSQFSDKRVSAIKEMAEKLCQEYFNAFPDVDTFDLFFLLQVTANHQRTMVAVKEAPACPLPATSEDDEVI